MAKKILVLQLARLGDIYQTWPVLRALKRKFPESEIHLLTRRSFAAAATGLEVISRHWALDTQSIIAPLIDEIPKIDESLVVLERFCQSIKAEQFNQVINLSFSPFSSYLMSQIEAGADRVRGYTRYTDGYLRIPDDGSAYFYAQVGVGKFNRLHVTDLFAHVADVELQDDDWVFPQPPKFEREGLAFESTDYAVLHIGASDMTKTLSASKWLSIARGFLGAWPGDLVLVGSPGEMQIAEHIAAVSGERKPINLTGKTTLPQLVGLIQGAKLVIGGDSAPVQIASLTGTPVLNISLPSVSFWETGPRSTGSRILRVASEAEISAEEITGEALAMLGGRISAYPAIRVLGRLFPYLEARPQAGEFEWALLRAIYMGEPFPLSKDAVFAKALGQLSEVNQLAIQQIASLRKNPKNTAASSILDRVDEVMDHVARIVVSAEPIVCWFKTEKIRIGPALMATVIQQTENIHIKLQEILDLYLDSKLQKGAEHDDLNVE